MWTPFITYINYNAKCQRTICRYANGLTTTYAYDDRTFRLMRLKTTRKAIERGRSAKIFKDPGTIQDLRYTYDPVGNITRIEDDALKTVFHGNQQIDAACEYTYDPVYRLVEATGREHIGQSAFNFLPEHGDYRDYPFEGAAQLGDLQAIQRYIERYYLRFCRQFPEHAPSGGAPQLDALLYGIANRAVSNPKEKQSPERDSA